MKNPAKISKLNLKSNYRIVSLDWLRGIMALSIMFYHLTDFTITISDPLDSSDPLGRLGIYGVSIFFILSGLSMAIVYNNYFKDTISSLNFYIRRIFRIWPLLWLVCILKVMFTEYIAREAHYSLITVFLNLTTLFGFIKPTAYIALGAWSIGNEMVYYAFTPFIIMSYNKNIKYGNVLFLITVITGVLFSTLFLNSNSNLADQWATYVNPFNNLFLYVFGIAIYYNLKNVKINQAFVLALLSLATCLFCLLPFSGDQIVIVTGLGRFSFVLISCVIVFCFYKLEVKLPETVTRFFEAFGAATYGIYLLHPIVYMYAVHFFREISGNYLYVFFLVVTVTIIISVLSYYYFESKFVRLGKNLTLKSRNK